MKAGELQRILMREPLNYRVVRRSPGSHQVMRAPGLPQILYAFHKNQTVARGLVRKILVTEVGLSEETALKLLGQ